MGKKQFNNEVNSLFLVNLPLVDSYDDVEAIKKLYPKYDPYFIASGVIKERREKFNNLWPKYKPYADTNFLNEVQKHFHQRTWEMYMGNILLEHNLNISSKDKGPDFVINNEKEEEILYIECVCTSKGNSEKNKSDSVIDPIESSNLPWTLHNVPTDKMILRITNAINNKVKIYKEYIEKETIKSDIPFIIAINTNASSLIEDWTSNVIKALFGVSHPQITMGTGRVKFLIRDEIQKENGAPISVNIFKSSEFEFISGIIFSNTDVLNHPETIGDDCIFVNNPFAKYPVSKSFYDVFKSYNAYIKDNMLYLKKNF